MEKINFCLKRIYSRNIIIPTVLAIISSISLYYYYIQRFVTWHPLILLTVLPLYWFFHNYHFDFKKTVIVNIVSSVSSIIAVTILMLSANLYYETPILYINCLKLGIMAIGLLVIFFCLFYVLINIVIKINYFEDRNSSNKRFFFATWGLIFISWVPYLIAFFPTVMTSDSIDQWLQATGKSVLFNHHPVAHTLLIRATMFIGQGHLVSYSIFQMIFLSLSMSLIVVWLYSKGLKKIWLYLIIVFFAFHPLNGMYSITMWKDVIFSVFIALLTLIFSELIMTKGKSGKNILWLTGLFISALGVMFFRNNGVYILIPATIAIVAFLKESRIRVLCVLLVTIFIYIVITGPVFNNYGIKKSSLRESLGIPIQQVARVIVDDGKFSAYDKKLIKKVIPISEIKKNYTNAGVDPLKFNKFFQISVINKDKTGYLNLWLHGMENNPHIYIAAYLDATRGFWDPLTKNWSISFNIDKNNYKLKQSRPIPVYSYYFEKTISDLGWEMPFYLFWSGALLNYLMLLGCAIMIICGRWRYIIATVPVFLNWATLLVATPIASSTRYVYSSFIAFPVISFMVFYSIYLYQKENKEH